MRLRIEAMPCTLLIGLIIVLPRAGAAQSVPSAFDQRIEAIATAPSAARIRRDIETLVGFGTRHTLSDTVSRKRGIGAARRWVRSEFERISADCGGCLEVVEQWGLVKAGTNPRIPVDTWVVNEYAVLRGDRYPDRYVIMSGDIDSRVTDPNDATSDAPGANDNASGMAGALEAARVLSKHHFAKSIVFAGLSGEEQGLFGGAHMAEVAKEQGWTIEAVLNNDMIGNVSGIDGVVENNSFRVFSEAVSMLETDAERRTRRYTGGEVDGPSRQLARYVEETTRRYLTNLEPMMIYRLDRFGRGGHHRPFNDAGFPGVRIMETHENYDRQHQDVRRENGIAYGDVLSGVDFDYAARLTGVNAAVLASLAWAPPPPDSVEIRGAVEPSTTLSWDRTGGDDVAGYEVVWRRTTEPQWTNARFVGDVTTYTLEDLVIDNWFFGVRAVGKDGQRSVVVFPTPGR